MNHVEFLEDTLAYYSEDTNRRAATNDQRCFYLTLDGKKCAFGRHILPGKYSASMEGIDINMIEHASPEPVFPEWMQKLDTNWKSSVQNFHDRNDYWATNKLTEIGERVFADLLRWAQELDQEKNS